MTSYMVGLVLASSSVGFTSDRGETRKKRVDAARDISTIIIRFLPELRNRSTSLVPSARPTPMIGPIRGEMSMAPMITAVEFTFRPTEAMTMEKARIQTLGPRNQMAFLILWAAASVSTWS